MQACAIPMLALFVALPSVAQYKVIGADGRVTYSDRAPNTTEGRVGTVAAGGGVAAADAQLPFELRQIVSRYPVTLYVASGGCEPCEAGRALLRQRGVPYSEKVIASAEDSDALEKLSGGRDAPTLTIGAQVVRGMATGLWSSYLDAAGYPPASKLPANYQFKAATPMIERREAAVPPAPQRPANDPTPFDRAPAASGIRF